MRVTVTLPDRTYHRVKEIAQNEGESVSSVIAELTARGLADSAPSKFSTSPITGLPTVSIGHTVTVAEAAELAAEE
ncbi:MAG: hypothetical protein Q4D96_11720 [Propionibacteriaceae bacterium]|nr:hypothetical protein [Propionibacteriaceae bacterium]